MRHAERARASCSARRPLAVSTGLIAWVQFGQQASGRHCRHRDDAQSEGSVEPLGQHLRFRLADLAGGEELAPNIAALDGIAVDEGQGQRGAASPPRGAVAAKAAVNAIWSNSPGRRACP